MSSNMVRPSKPVERVGIEPERNEHPGTKREINEVHRSNSSGEKLADYGAVSGQGSIGKVGSGHKESIKGAARCRG